MTNTAVATSSAQAELGEDVSQSPLWNKDLAPTTIAQRTWSTWNIAALWIGMSVVVSTYMLAGGMIESGMTWWQAMLTVLLGNTIVLVPMCLNRSEEHTSELQSRLHLVCRLLLEKKKK